MSLKKNNAFINLQADVFDAFNGGAAKIYSGTQPADPNSAASGTLLASITIPSPAFGAPSGGTIDKAGTWQDTSADATGTAGYMRIATSDGLKWFDITVTASGGGGDAIINNAAITAGNTVTVSSLSITVPAV